MSDDPRLEAVERFLEEQLDAPFTWAVGILAAADAADKAAGIVRIDLSPTGLERGYRFSAVLVDRLASAVGDKWPVLWDEGDSRSPGIDPRDVVQVMLAALPGEQ